MKKFFVFLATAVLACSCGLLANTEWDSEQLASATGKAATAMSLTNEQIIELSKQSVEYMDKENTVDNGAYAKRLNKLLGGVTVSGLELNFKVYKTEEVNAFACGDGSIRVYSGLMDIMNDGELMAIIGHEIGHVVHKDTKNQMKKAYLASAARDAISAAGGIVGTLSSSVVGDLAEAYMGAQFSQKQEYKADQYGFEFSTTLGYDPYSMATSLEKLVELAGGAQASLVAKMFSSHPDSAERAEKVRAQADVYVANQ